MPRPSDPIEDLTDLDGPRIDIAARIGWLLRISRASRGVSLREMSRQLSLLGRVVSVPTLSTLERQGVREGLLIDRYEHVLQLPPGHLRAPVDVLCRTFSYAPADRAGDLVGPAGLREVDAAFAPVMGGTATGGEWFAWARLVGAGTGAAVPSEVITPLVQRLLEELVRAVGLAYVTRYEAIASLRCGVYGELVEDVVRRMVLDEATQAAAPSVLTAVAEHPTRRLLAWLGELLEHDCDIVVAAACRAMENLRTVGGLEASDWQVVVAPFLRAHALAEGPERGEWLTVLFKNLPPGARHSIRSRLDGPLWPLEGPRSWGQGPGNAHHAICERLAAEAVEVAGLEPQPMLARLLFELLYDFRGARVATSAWLLMASPVVEELQDLLVGLARTTPDDVTARAAVRALRHLQAPRGEDRLRAWMIEADLWEDASGLVVAANAAVRVPDALGRVRQAPPSQALRLVEALGMAEDPDLAEIAADEDLAPGLRAWARWWLRVGGRVVA